MFKSKGFYWGFYAKSSGEFLSLGHRGVTLITFHCVKAICAAPSQFDITHRLFKPAPPGKKLKIPPLQEQIVGEAKRVHAEDLPQAIVDFAHQMFTEGCQHLWAPKLRARMLLTGFRGYPSEKVNALGE